MSAEADAPIEYTYRDSTLRAPPVVAANRAGAWGRRRGWEPVPLSSERIAEAAADAAGTDDFGGDEWREALDVLIDSIEREAKLSTMGRFAIRGLLTGALTNRLKVLAWVRDHPEVADERIDRPWAILGLPRTGTSLLSILIGLDPEARPILSWEASSPVPPPTLATHLEDPRIAESAKRVERLQKMNPAMMAMHPFGATVATECVALFLFDVRSMAIETQAFVPSYGRWLADCDMSSAFAIHRATLQVLQSELPTGSWVLKTPHYLWCIDQLVEAYTDARIVWTHRDLGEVVPSLASLNCALLQMGSDEVDPHAVGEEWHAKAVEGIARGMAHDEATEPGWCCHVRYQDLMADPVGAVVGLYESFGVEVRPLHRRRMEMWMRERHQAAFGRHVYDAADFGLDPDTIREQQHPYGERFGV